MTELPVYDPFHDCELGPDAVLGTRTFQDVLFTDDTERPVNVLTRETPVHSQGWIGAGEGPRRTRRLRGRLVESGAEEDWEPVERGESNDVEEPSEVSHLV